MRQRRKAADEAMRAQNSAQAGHGEPMHGEHAMQGGAMPGGTAAYSGAAPAGPGGRAAEEFAAWENRTRVNLTPLAAPSILGLFGFAGSTLMVGAWQANWFGNALTPLAMVPFTLFFGGLAQFLAGMWAYRVRDGLATAMHGMWGAFWLAYSLMLILVATGAYPALLAPRIGVQNQGFAMWFVALCVITGIGAIAALGRSLAITGVLTVLTVGAGFTAAGFFAPSSWALHGAGWMFVVSAALALYVAAALLFENSFGRTVLPVGKALAMPGLRGIGEGRPLQYQHGEPGVRIGQ